MAEGSISIEQDHFPEVADKAFHRTELLGVKDKLNNSTARREFFRSIPNEGYKKTIGYVNSITRDKPIEYDYANGQLHSEDTPPLEDKAPLMDLTFDTVRNILSNDTLDNATALRIAGLALAGAISYIHPYENGNGRTGRVLHYLVEFGTERGEQAFNEELYAIIGKLPMYDVDGYKKALMDTPPPELPLALGQEYNRINNQQSSATERVKIFLQMMQGLITVPIQKDVYRPGGGIIPAGIDGKSLYTKEYLDYSTIPYRKPNEAPPEAIRNLGVKKENPEYISMLMDLVD